MTARVPFEVPGWIEWAWGPLVPFTAAFHWPALAAVFTFLALINTARIADAQRREERRKQSAFIEAVAMVVAHCATPAEAALKKIDSGGDPRREMGVSAATERVLNTVAQLEEIKLTDFGDPEALAEFVAARLAMRSILNLYKDFADPKITPDVEFLRGRVTALDASVENLMTRARKSAPFSSSDWAGRFARSLFIRGQ